MLARILRRFARLLSGNSANTHGSDWFDRGQLLSYLNRHPARILYGEGIKRTNQVHTDNLSKQSRFFGLYQLVRRAAATFSEGDVAECGCWRGLSTYIISSILKEHRYQGVFHVFDSFQGLSDFSEKDHHAQKTQTDADRQNLRKYFAVPEQELNWLLDEFSFLRFYQGWIPSRFNEVAERTFRFVHIDVDLYQPTRDSLAFFFPRLVPGGIIAFDDYGFCSFPGAKAAIDEYLADKTFRLFYEVPTGGAFLVK